MDGKNARFQGSLDARIVPPSQSIDEFLLQYQGGLDLALTRQRSF